jgi:hypothetical protein
MKEARWLAWRSQMPGKPTLDPEDLDSPYLTLAINLGSALGGFIGLWTVIYLIADLHRGFASYWWLIAIVIIDVGINVALRVIRARRRARDPDAMADKHGSVARSTRHTSASEWRDINDERRT